MRYLLMAVMLTLCSGSYQHRAKAQVEGPQILSGSNFIWYRVDPAQCAAGNPAGARDPFAVITAYGTPKGRPIVDAALATMRERGQQIIALGLIHRHGASGNNTVLDSTGGALAPTARQSLSDLIDTIISLKFRVLYLRFFPSGINYVPVKADETLSLETDIYQENVGFIDSVMGVTQGKNIEIITDLCNECSPSSTAFDNPTDRLQARLTVYTRHIWSDYVRKYGPAHSVGFSVIPDRFRIANLPRVYELGGTRPSMLDLHFYPSAMELDLLRCRQLPGDHDCGVANACLKSPVGEQCRALFAGSLFDDVARQLADVGFGMPWIVGETYYEDPKSATYLRTGMALTHHEIKYIFQWPLRRPPENERTSDPCADPTKGGGVNVEIPLDIDAYTSIGRTVPGNVRNTKPAQPN